MVNKSILLLFVGLLLIGLVSGAVTDESVWFKFNGNLNNDGVIPTAVDLRNGATYTTTAKLGSYAINTSIPAQLAYVNISLATPRDEDFSMGFWVWINNTPAGVYNPYFTTGTNGIYFATTFAGTTRLRINNASSGGLNMDFTLTPTLRTWYYYTIIYNKSNDNLTFYQNGVVIRSLNTGNRFFLPNTDLGLGFEGGCNGVNLYNDFRIWYNYSLKTEEILSLYNSGSGTDLGLTTIYAPLSCNLIYPLNNSVTEHNSYNLSVYSIGNSSNPLKNITLRLYNVLTGLQINNHTFDISSFYNQTNWSIGTLDLGRYKWEAKVCSTANNCYNTGNNSFRNYIIINITNQLGDLVTGTRIRIPSLGIDDSGLSGTWFKSSSVLLRGLNNYPMYVNVSESGNAYGVNNTLVDFKNSQKDYVISLDPNKLVLNFSGVTNGTWADSVNYGKNFSQSQIIIVHKNISEGLVTVRWGEVAGQNWTQFYEYINSFGTNVFENLWLLNDDDCLSYMKVVDSGNAPIEGAIIRAYSGVLNGTAMSAYNLIGQRLTDNRGLTYFISDCESPLATIVTKEGYSIWTRNDLDIANNLANTIDGAVLITLTSNIENSVGAVQYAGPKWFSNRSLNIGAYLFALGATKVEYITSYKRSLSGAGGITEIERDILGTYPFALLSGVDFESSGSNNINLEIWINSDNLMNVSIVYRDLDTGEDIAPLDSFRLDEDTTRFALGILLIIVSCMLSFIFRNADIGFNGFMIGGIILSVFSSGFLWLTLINVSYYALIGVRKIVGD